MGNVAVDEIETEFSSRSELLTRQIDDFLYTTTREIVREEREILAFLERTRGTAPRLRRKYTPSKGIALDTDQLAAVRALLKSRDRVFIIEGRAGTGKTTLMREAVAAIELGGNEVYTFAPTSEAAHNVLKSEGFENSETVQQLLINTKLQQEINGKILWVDEAGLLSSKDMNRLVKIADEQDARLILSGDTRQHHSVQRGDALRIMAESGLAKIAFTSRVHRQRKSLYKRIVELIAGNSPQMAFEKLNDMGAIHEIADKDKRLALIAEDYVESCKAHDSVLVVSPTHAEGDEITRSIRECLRAIGEIGREEKQVTTLESRSLTVAQRKQAMNYRLGDVVRFHRKTVQGFKSGDTLEIARVGLDGKVWVKAKGIRVSISAIYRNSELF